MRVCIAGKNEIAVSVLRYALQELRGVEIVGLSNPSDGGVNGWQPSFRRACAEADVPLASIAELQVAENLLLLSFEYERLLDVEKFRSDRLYNLHFSLLPKYKGAYTAIWPILNGETETGVTLHRIDKGIDTGNIVAQSTFAIGANDTSRDLYFSYMRHGAQLAEAWLPALLAENVGGRPQDALHASFYSRKSIDFGRLQIDFKACAQQVHNQVRAFCFREYQLPVVEGSRIERSQILRARSVSRPGDIVEQGERSLRVATVDFDVLLAKSGN
jgi:methionyl-tRNA formyltransferase